MMKSLSHQFILFVGVMACCLWMAGCAGGPSTNNAPEFRDKTMSAQQASGAVAIGSSTKANVIAALGPANVVKFDTGYEVWVYRAGTGPASSEFVILFSPDGIARKTRIRPAYQG